MVAVVAEELADLTIDGVFVPELFLVAKQKAALH